MSFDEFLEKMAPLITEKHSLEQVVEVRACMCMCMCMYICVYTYVCVCMCVCMIMFIDMCVVVVVGREEVGGGGR